jgi:hypothetical protein
MDERKLFEVAAGDTLGESERLLKAFSGASEIGFAVLDRGLRYQVINGSLAVINGIPAAVHLGVTVGELFGEISQKVAEPIYRQILSNGESAQFEVSDVALPTRPGSRYWGLNTNFPIRNRGGQVSQLGIMVIEVTHQRRLQGLISAFPERFHNTNSNAARWYAREMQDAIDQYHSALALGLKILVKESDKSTELLTRSIAMLDQSILVMRNIVEDATQVFSSPDFETEP